MAENNRSLRKLSAALITAIPLGACSLMAPHPPSAQTSAQPSAEASAQQTPLQPPSPPAARENHLSPVTRSLVTQAQTQLTKGDLPAASSTLDRALRIEPNNPLLWIELGRLRLAENDAHQAESCARKALALASGDRDTQAQSGRLLADALRAQQRNQEAREVESQPFMR
jgi:uncharacterized protein HemY